MKEIVELNYDKDLPNKYEITDLLKKYKKVVLIYSNLDPNYIDDLTDFFDDYLVLHIK